MTMLFTHQPSAIHAFDHNACNRLQASPPIKSAILQYHAPTSVDQRQTLVEKPSWSSLHESFEAQAAIVMPCPKKAAVLCSNAFLGGNPLSPVMTIPPRWGLSSVVEDSQEDEALPTNAIPVTATITTAATTTTDIATTIAALVDDDDQFEQAACAELMEIMSSNGSSRSSSQSSSPQPSLHENDSFVSEQSAFPSGLFEEYTTFFGTSPIVRANNPLPNDHSFSPSHPDPDASEVAQWFLARHRHQVKVFDFDLNVDEAHEKQALRL